MRGSVRAGTYSYETPYLPFAYWTALPTCLGSIYTGLLSTSWARRELIATIYVYSQTGCSICISYGSAVALVADTARQKKYDKGVKFLNVVLSIVERRNVSWIRVSANLWMSKASAPLTPAILYTFRLVDSIKRFEPANSSPGHRPSPQSECPNGPTSVGPHDFWYDRASRGRSQGTDLARFAALVQPTATGLDHRVLPASQA